MPNHPTIHHAHLNGWTITVFCAACGYGRQIDLEAFRLGPHYDRPIAEVWARPGFKCAKVIDGKLCGARASSMVVSRLQVGKTVDVMRLG